MQEGEYGEVRICVHRTSGSERSVKILKKNHMDDYQKRTFYNEITILKDLDHPNIIKMYEFFEDRKRFYIVTDICKGGELFEIIEEHGKFNEKDTCILMKSILGCVNYCHLNNVIHRDLKPENVLMEKSLESDSIKIIDFGLSVKAEAASRYSEMVGTPYYVAPEVMNKNYGKKIDVWACGVITYILLGGVPPFNGHSDKEILKKVKKGKISF